jgi:CRP/FNR family transcriptional regulator, cyclic AMP receptor protein
MAATAAHRPGAAAARGTSARVLDVIDGVAAGLDGPALAAAREHVTADVVTLSGERRAVALPLDRARHGLLVCSGFLLLETSFDGRAIAELVGPGDVLLAPRPDALSASCETSSRPIGPVRLALLDDAFELRAAPWPGILTALLRRAGERAVRSSAERAMLAVPNVELRIQLFLRTYAVQWGQVRDDGFLVPVAITHDALGLLIGARRPTVTTALSALRARGVLELQADRTWLLRPDDVPALTRTATPAPGTPSARDALLMAAPLSQRFEAQRERLARVRESHEAAVATMRDRTDVLRVRAARLRTGLADAQLHERERD